MSDFQIQIEQIMRDSLLRQLEQLESLFSICDYNKSEVKRIIKDYISANIYMQSKVKDNENRDNN